MNTKEYLQRIICGSHLQAAEAAQLLEQCYQGKISIVHQAMLFIALHTRGEHLEELRGGLHFFRQHIAPVLLPPLPTVDICGTGGDHANTFNISTAAALVIASQGDVAVAKHGGRSVSSKSGSIDVLDALAIPICQAPDQAAKALQQDRCAFLSAPHFNPAFLHFSQLRKAMGIRTCLNILGPILNPARVKRQVVGVFTKSLLLPVAELLRASGSTEVIVVHAQDGLDELSLNAPTDFIRLHQGQYTSHTITPEQVGLSPAPLSSLQSNDAADSAAIICAVCEGQPGPCRDVVVFNAAAGFLVSGTASSFAEAVKIAQHCIDSGKTLTFLHHLQQSQCHDS